MKKSLLILVVIVGLITTVVAQKEKTGSISGTVRGNNGVLNRATVTLKYGNQLIGTELTDDKGQYRFINLKAGDYELDFEADWYLTGHKKVKVKSGYFSLCNVKLTEQGTRRSAGLAAFFQDVGESDTLSTVKDGVKIVTVAKGFSSRGSVGSGTGAGPGSGFASVSQPNSMYLPRSEGSQMISGDSGSLTNSSNSYVFGDASRSRLSHQGNYYPFPSQETSKYSELEENDFRSPIHKPLSTFSIDVDTAYYTLLRNSLNSGRMLPANSVRIEEMINYFDYDYPQPKGKDVFSIYTELGVNPWNSERQLLHIGLRGKDVDISKAPPSNLVFLVDVSGSMNQYNKLPLVKQSLLMLTDQMRPQDKIAVVTYAGSSGLAVPSTSGRDKQVIKDAINRFNAGGSTAGGAGIQLAYQVATDNYVKGGTNRIILCTDGDFNVGLSRTSDLVNLVAEKAKNDIYLTVLGFGTGNLNDKMMEEITNKGNGNYAYIDNFDEARKVLYDEFAGTLFTIAKDVKIQVEFNPTKVKAYRLIGYVNRKLRAEDFKDDTKDAGELGSGHTVTAIYEVVPIDSREILVDIDDLKYQKKNSTGSSELATVKLRYKMPDSDTSIPLDVTVSSKAKPSSQCSDTFLFSAAVAGFGMLVSEGDYNEHLDLNKVRELAGAHTESRDTEIRQEFIELIDAYGGIKGIGSNRNYWD